VKRWLFALAVLAMPFVFGLWDLVTFTADPSTLSGGHPALSAVDRHEPSKTIVYAMGALIIFCTLAACAVVWQSFPAKPKLPPCDYCGMPGIKIISKRDGFSRRSVCIQHDTSGV